MESKKRNWGKPEGKKLTLYDLRNDIHEDNNVAESNPQIVKKLQSLAESARKDLGDLTSKKEQRGWLVDTASPRLRK